jgi:hypothetical protein
MNIQEAFAYILVNDEARNLLRDCPRQLQANLELSDEDISLLSSLDSDKLALMAEGGRSKRRNFLHRGLPSALTAISLASRNHIVDEFLRATALPVQSGNTNRTLTESREFVTFLNDLGSDRASEVIKTIAQFELSQLDLIASKEASAWALRAEESMLVLRRSSSGLALQRIGDVILGKHVLIAKYSYDVTSLVVGITNRLSSNVAALERRSAFVMSIKRAGRCQITVSRVGNKLACLLLGCKAPVSIDSLFGMSEFQSDTTSQILCQMLFNGVLLPTSVLT